jgi:hypothetical protein
MRELVAKMAMNRRTFLASGALCVANSLWPGCFDRTPAARLAESAC